MRSPHHLLRRRRLMLALASAPLHAETPTLRLAAEDDWPPFSSLAPGSKPPRAEGFSVDLLRAALATQGVEVEFEPMPFARCMALVDRGEVQGCFNVTINDENRALYTWHELPLLEEALTLYARRGETRHDLKLSDLRGRRVAYTHGYTYPSEFFQDPLIKREKVMSDQAQLRMLLNRRVDFALLYRTPASLRISRSPELRGQIEPVGQLDTHRLYVAFAKSDPRSAAYARQLDQGLRLLHADGRYQQLQQQWRERAGYR